MDDQVRRFVAAQKQCTYCPRLCRHACPVETASGREALTPKFKMQTALELRENRRALGPDAIETLWGCSACGACEDECLHDNPVGAALYEARALAVSRGKQPAALSGVRAAFEQRVFLREDLDKAAFAEVRRGPLRADICVLLEDSSDELARAAFLASRRVRPDAKVASMWDADAPIVIRAGRELREAGEQSAYDLHSARVSKALAGCKEWWVLELASLDDFEKAAALIEPRPVVRSLVEVMAGAGLGPSRRFRSVAVHLGCSVRRRPAVEEAIGVLAHRLSDDVRMPALDMPFAGCCGGRGLIGTVLPDVAGEMAAGRSSELRDLKAEVTVTFSAPCHGMMPGAIHGVPFFAPSDW